MFSPAGEYIGGGGSDGQAHWTGSLTPKGRMPSEFLEKPRLCARLKMNRKKEVGIRAWVRSQ